MDISKPIRTWSLMSIVVFFAIAHAVSASSDSQVDCSGIATWNADKSYTKGDLVIAKTGVTEYECLKDTCSGVSENQPGSGNASVWNNVGVCR